MATEYRAVKINVPKGRAERAVLGLVPKDSPVSTALLNVLLDEAVRRGFDEPESDVSDTAGAGKAAKRKDLKRLTARVATLEDRVEALTNMVARGRR